MSKVVSAHAVSVDGYITGRDPGAGRGLGDGAMLFDWYFGGDTPSQVFDGFRMSEPSARVFDALAARVGADDHHQKPASNRHQEMTMTLDPTVRRVLDGTPVAHLASVLPDGAPHSVPVWIGTYGDHIVFLTGPQSRKARNLRRDPRVALSLTPPDNPFQPIIVRGRVVEWLEGDAAWAIVDQLAAKYIGQPYSRDEERVVAVIEPERQTVGLT